MRVLLVEGDNNTARDVKLLLEIEEYICDATNNSEDALEIAKLDDYDIIILDLLTLLSRDTYAVLQEFCRIGAHTSVLVLSGLPGGADPAIKCLNIGADDYMTKPFDKGELVARIQAIVRRSWGHSHPTIEAGKLSVNMLRRTVIANGVFVHLPSKEYSIVELLCLRRGRIVNKETILSHLYGEVDVPDIKIVDVFICKLRKKIETVTGGDPCIETTWGRGYIVADPEAKVQTDGPTRFDHSTKTTRKKKTVLSA